MMLPNVFIEMHPIKIKKSYFLSNIKIYLFDWRYVILRRNDVHILRVNIIR